MSVTQRTTSQDASSEMRCPNCNSVLPPHAIFCSTCGERVNKDSLKAPATQPDTNELSERYRVTSLIRRSGYTQLLLAMDMRHSRPVLIRDIDISSLDEEEQKRAVETVQHEYDMLRRLRIPDVTPLIDLRYSNNHLYVAGGWPFPLPDAAKEGNGKAYTPTLQDLLQSGIGLPSEQVALAWIHRLSVVVGLLHTIYIFLGDLDPATIVVSDRSYDAVPALTVSWLPVPIRSLLKPLTPPANESLFMAPEALTGDIQPRSDIYSLGALLYFLLTGNNYNEQQSQRIREANPRISSATEAIVTRALATEQDNRYKRVEEMEEALLLALENVTKVRKTRALASKKGKRNVDEATEQKDNTEEVTVSIVSLQSQLARWQLDKLQADAENGHAAVREAIADTPTISTAHIRDALQQTPPVTPEVGATNETLDNETLVAEDGKPEISASSPEPMPRPDIVPTREAAGEVPLLQRFRERVSGILPAMPRSPKTAAAETVAATTTPSLQEETNTDTSFLKRLQRFLLGEQQNTTTAAALIETPQRIQPNQSYAIRVHLMGRDIATLPPHAKKGSQPVGLSAIVRDEVVHIEIRSSIFQNYAYVIQRADVHIPGEGFAAEVTIPMQPLSNGQNGRRERLHIYFMDEARRPLYERPFAIEILVSHLVQAGREGHAVLTIPV